MLFLHFVFQSSLSNELYTNSSLNFMQEILNVFLQHFLPFLPNLLERNTSKCKSHTNRFKVKQSLINRILLLVTLFFFFFLSSSPLFHFFALSFLPCLYNFYNSSSFFPYSSLTFILYSFHGFILL